MSEESPQEILEGADLCLCCLEPVRPGASRCVTCGAPQDFVGCTLPFLQVLAEGFVYHRAIQQPRSWLSVAGIWVIFGLYALSSLFVLAMAVPQFLSDPSLGSFAPMMTWLAYGVLGISGIVVCTNNYVAHRRRPVTGA